MNKPANENMQRFLALKDKISAKIGGQFNLAILLIVVSNLYFPINFLYPNEHKIHPIVTSLSRGIGILLTHIPICLLFDIQLNFKALANFKILFLRNIIMVIHQGVYTALYFVVPYPITNTITVSGALFVFIIDYIVNKVTINKKQIVGITFGILGVILTINGEYIYSLVYPEYKPSSKFQHYLVDSIWVKTICCFIFLICCFLWAIGVIAQKRLRSVTGIQISFHLGILFLFTSATFYSAYGAELPEISPQSFFMTILLSGIPTGFCQILFISGLNLSKNTGILSLLNLINILTSYLISFFRYNQALNVICVIGLVIMVLGLYEAIVQKQQNE